MADEPISSPLVPVEDQVASARVALGAAVAVVRAVSDALGGGAALSNLAEGLRWFGESVAPLARVVSAALPTVKETLAGLQEIAESWRRRSFPPNVVDLPELRMDALVALSDEGITVWTVPRPAIAARLLSADSPQARRRVLGQSWRPILKDCADEAAKAVASDHVDLARLLEQAIRAVQAGHTAAGQALAASVLDALLSTTFVESYRRDLVRHPRGNPKAKVMNHFDELTIGEAMVLRPIWFAYRPQDTHEQRAASSAFARHATAHHIHGRQVSRRNAVQAIMLGTALLSYIPVYDAARAETDAFLASLSDDERAAYEVATPE
ncbi:hypothetical protein [Cellulomonas triticagri]|uniref:Uncharacterized protein n=1 Tax=Cellulomonas triticagri TaxID=2483352 RepID=A0A3M2JSP6_9CELL|nr:hypothetical protein [Cellulomonas triticagri]RMI13238.1 hypothetical protein EBM89_05285 [Cellulomonas triticagri]